MSKFAKVIKFERFRSSKEFAKFLFARTATALVDPQVEHCCGDPLNSPQLFFGEGDNILELCFCGISKIAISSMMEYLLQENISVISLGTNSKLQNGIYSSESYKVFCMRKWYDLEAKFLLFLLTGFVVQLIQVESVKSYKG